MAGLDAGYGISFDETEFPAYFDLRSRGVVTPVKTQNPWGTCWAFAAIAAAETSALSATGQTYDQTGLDFSEKHLSWFPFVPITDAESSSQAGEGIYLVDNSQPNGPFEVGLGYSALIMSLFADESGPADESSFPYRGSEGLTQFEFFNYYPDEAKEFIRQEVERTQGISFEEYAWQTYPGIPLEDALEYEYEQYKAFYLSEDCYAKYDDWNIEDIDAYGNPNRSATSKYAIKDCNYLPQLNYHDADGYWTDISPEGMAAAKRELLDGHGVAVCLAADQSEPGIWSDAMYMNTDTWSHYTFEDVPIDHEVCIVGWDDDYSLTNFNEAYPPPGNGAWLAKNSWGSESEAFVAENGDIIGNSPWGLLDENGRHTGYFYISYYDKSLTDPQSFSFFSETDASDDILQYDYLPGVLGTYSLSSQAPLSTANVFTSSKNGSITAVSTRTSDPDMHVRFDIYLLDDDAATPTDGVLAASQWQRFAYTGFHRLNLSQAIDITEGQRFSVVCTAFLMNDEGSRSYKVFAIKDKSEDYILSEGDQADPFYARVVLNQGESYVYHNDEWEDWAAYLDNRNQQNRPAVIDNFCIKAYIS